MNSTTIIDCVNKVSICGTIVRKFNGENWLGIVIATSTKEGTSNFPTVFWFDDMAKEVDAKYTIGSRVEVNGSLRTSKEHPDTSIVGEFIAEMTSWVEAKFDSSKEYKPDHNEVLLKGSFVRGHSHTPEISNITVRVEIDGYTYFPEIACFNSYARKASTLAEDDIICIVARIQTRKKETANGKKYYQTVVCCSMKVN